MNQPLLLGSLLCLLTLQSVTAVADESREQSTARQQNAELRKDIAAKQAAIAQQKGLQAPAKIGETKLTDAPLQTQDSPETGSDK